MLSSCQISFHRYYGYQRRTCFKYVSVVTKRNVSHLYVIHQSCWSGSRRVQTPRCSFFSCHGCDVWILSCSRAILPKEKFVGFQSLLKSWRSIFLWTKSPLLSCPIATERTRSQLKYIVKYRYTDVSARTRASQIGKLLRCSDEIEIQSRIYADIRIRTYVIVSKQGLRSSEIVSPDYVYIVTLTYLNLINHTKTHWLHLSLKLQRYSTINYDLSIVVFMKYSKQLKPSMNRPVF